MPAIQLLAKEEPAERPEEYKESRDEITAEEQTEGHIRLADKIEHQPAIHRRGVDDLLEALFEFFEAGMVVVGVPGETTEFGVEEEIERAVAMLEHSRDRMRIQRAVRMLPVAEDRGKRHGHIPLEGHDRRLVAIGMSDTGGVDYDTIGLHPDAGLRRSIA